MLKARRVLLTLSSVVGAGIGAWLAVGAIQAPSGYAAAYAFGGAWILSAIAITVGLVIAGLLFLLNKRSTARSVLLGGLLGATTLLVSFYAVYAVGAALTPNRWPGDRMVRLDEGPHFVVVFRADATERDIEAFIQRKIDVPSANGRGHDLRRQVRSIGRTPPMGGQQTLTVGYWKSLSAAERERLRISLASWPAVDRIVNDLPFPDHPPQMLPISPTAPL